MISKLAFSSHVSQRCLEGTAKHFRFRVQNRARNDFLPLCLQTYSAKAFLLLCSFFNNYPWTFEKNSFSTICEHKNINSLAKSKVRGLKGENWPNVASRQLRSRKKRTTKIKRHCLQSKIFPSLSDTGSYNLCCNIPQYGSTGKNRNIRAKNCFCVIFCIRSRLVSERLWQTTIADHCINKRQKNRRWSYCRLILLVIL